MERGFLRSRKKRGIVFKKTIMGIFVKNGAEVRFILTKEKGSPLEKGIKLRWDKNENEFWVKVKKIVSGSLLYLVWIR